MRTRKLSDPLKGKGELPQTGHLWDQAIGLRIGLAVGGLLGALIIALTGIVSFWILVFTAAIGGAIGFWSEKRKHRTHRL